VKAPRFEKELNMTTTTAKTPPPAKPTFEQLVELHRVRHHKQLEIASLILSALAGKYGAPHVGAVDGRTPSEAEAHRMCMAQNREQARVALDMAEALLTELEARVCASVDSLSAYREKEAGGAKGVN
jgi:hypothetical protein